MLAVFSGGCSYGVVGGLKLSGHAEIIDYYSNAGRQMSTYEKDGGEWNDFALYYKDEVAYMVSDSSV